MGANIEKTKDTFVYFLYCEEEMSERSAIGKTM